MLIRLDPCQDSSSCTHASITGQHRVDNEETASIFDWQVFSMIHAAEAPLTHDILTQSTLFSGNAAMVEKRISDCEGQRRVFPSD